MAKTSFREIRPPLSATVYRTKSVVKIADSGGRNQQQSAPRVDVYAEVHLDHPMRLRTRSDAEADRGRKRPSVTLTVSFPPLGLRVRTRPDRLLEQNKNLLFNDKECPSGLSHLGDHTRQGRPG